MADKKSTSGAGEPAGGSAPARGGGSDFVARIVQDPSAPPQTVMLTGFLGASSEDGHTRLYFDANLSSYVEIPDDAILHAQEASTAEGGLGGSYVWIKRDAELTYGPAGSQRPKGKFLEGPIMQAHMAGAGAGAAALPQTLLPPCGGPQTLLPPCGGPQTLLPPCGGPHTLLPPCGITLPAQCHITLPPCGVHTLPP